MRSRPGRLPPLGNRRPRRRWWPFVLVGALVALVIGEVTNQVVDSSTAAAKRSVASWVVAVGPVVDASTGLARPLQELRQGVQQNGRSRLERLLDQVVSTSEQEQVALDGLPLAPPSAAIGAALRTCIENRASATVALAGAVGLATGGAEGATSVARATRELERAATELRAADTAYDRFRRLLGARGASLPRHSTWLYRPDFWTDAALAHWARALHDNPALAGRAALELTAVTVTPRVLEIRGLPATTTTTTTTTTTSTTTTTTTTLPAGGSVPVTGTATTLARPPARHRAPAAVTTTTLQLPPAGSVSVLQPTKHLSVSAVVADTGTMPLRGVTVAVELRPRGGSSGSSAPGGSRSVGVGTLRPGGARYVVLKGFHPEEGHRYLLVVRASADRSRTVVDRVALCDASSSGACP